MFPNSSSCQYPQFADSQGNGIETHAIQVILTSKISVV
jgi:hypothetical protein